MIVQKGSLESLVHIRVEVITQVVTRVKVIHVQVILNFVDRDFSRGSITCGVRPLTRLVMHGRLIVGELLFRGQLHFEFTRQRIKFLLE